MANVWSAAYPTVPVPTPTGCPAFLWGDEPIFQVLADPDPEVRRNRDQAFPRPEFDVFHADGTVATYDGVERGQEVEVFFTVNTWSSQNAHKRGLNLVLHSVIINGTPAPQPAAAAARSAPADDTSPRKRGSLARFVSANN